MVKCNGCGLAHQNESYVGRLHGGCKRDGSWELQSKGEMQGQQLAKSAMADTTAQQAAMTQQQAAFKNQVVESASIPVLKKHISELESSVRVRDERIKELESNQPTAIHLNGLAPSKRSPEWMSGHGANERIRELESSLLIQAKRIAELENKLEAYKEGSDELQETTACAQRRANSLSDECGALKTQNTELLAENARLRRGGR